MLLFHDPSAAAADLAAGVLACPHRGCEGRLAPRGHARTRCVRVAPSRTEAHRPGRARCRSCRRTQVLGWARSYPRRPDTVETVGSALLAATSGLGYRPVAQLVGLPATTVRGWLQRARVNSETVRADATAAVYAFDPVAVSVPPTGSPLGDMLDAVGRAVSAAIRRFGPHAAPWQLATVITAAGILAARLSPRWVHRSS
jgi:hypothetical protein